MFLFYDYENNFTKKLKNSIFIQTFIDFGHKNTILTLKPSGNSK